MPGSITPPNVPPGDGIELTDVEALARHLLAKVQTQWDEIEQLRAQLSAQRSKLSAQQAAHLVELGNLCRAAASGPKPEKTLARR